ncbi:hypothetical protein GCM10010468_51420 [Actinocorallia longicatena]|uniref:HNH domain-containing protein n=1 Tax=Actinocorallia longicatena TaxID=111803 RepID=A0ABP6QFJ9_9ACTN
MAPLEIEHIEDWAKVKEHTFENMIVLCANCHGRKASGSRSLDRAALKQYKANLGLINQRYSSAEQRLLEYLAAHLDVETMSLPAGMSWLFDYLVRDGVIEIEQFRGPITWGMFQSENFGMDQARLTEAGKAVVRGLAEAQPLN